ncbi:hypothetical protein [Agromyces sp. NPDC055658]
MVASVEKHAVLAVEGLIVECPHLKSVIDTNDRTPITDGHIDMYRGLARSNTDFVGRMPVQVKGLSIGKRRLRPRYSISRGELDTLRKHGTVLYFVVFVSENGDRHPYYAILSPFAIDHILRSTPAKQKKPTLQLKEVPRDPKKLEGLVGLALMTQKQKDASDVSAAVFEKMASLTVHSVEGLDFSAPLVISPDSGEYALEIETEDGLRLPLDGELTILPPSYVEREVDLRVECGGIVYENPRSQQLDAERHELKLSNGLTMHIRLAEQTQTNSLNLTLVSNLADRVKDIDFYLSIVEQHPLTFNGSRFRFDVNDHAHLDELRDHRAYLGRLLELFDVLHVDPNLILLDEIDEPQHERLKFIYASLVKKRDLYAINGQPGQVLERVGRWALKLLVTPGSAPDTWCYVDPFDPDSRHRVRVYREQDGKQEEFAGTVYEGVTPSELPEILNLHLEAVVDAYRLIAELSHATGLANYEVLRLLAAADASDQRRDEFTRAATMLNEWLIEEEGATAIHRINRWQILSRTTGLGSADRQEIRDLRREVLIERPPRERQLEASCAILLGNQEDVDNCLRRLALEERQEMEEWPIWALHPDQNSFVEQTE